MERWISMRILLRIAHAFVNHDFTTGRANYGINASGLGLGLLDLGQLRLHFGDVLAIHSLAHLAQGDASLACSHLRLRDLDADEAHRFTLANRSRREGPHRYTDLMSCALRMAMSMRSEER